MTKFDVVGLGSCAVDYSTKIRSFSSDLSKVNCDNFKKNAGGVTANNLAQCSKLGLKTAYCGAIGNDLEGNFLIDSFKRDNVWPVVARFGSSQFCWIIVNYKGEHAIYVFPNCTKELTPKIVKKVFPKTISNCKHLHLEVAVMPLKCSIEAAKIAKKNKIKVVVDVDGNPFELLPGIGTKKELFELIKLTDVLKMSDGAATALFGKKDLKSTLKKLSGKHEYIAITKGSKGCYIANKKQVEFCPAIKTKVVDSTGAGDAFMAGLSYAILNNYKLKDIGNFANRCGSYACKGHGARYFGTLKEIR